MTQHTQDSVRLFTDFFPLHCQTSLQHTKTASHVGIQLHSQGNIPLLGHIHIRDHYSHTLIITLQIMYEIILFIWKTFGSHST